MPIKQVKAQPVAAVPADTMHWLTFADVAEWVEDARARGVLPAASVRGRITMGGRVKEISAVPGENGDD
jgi:hypothetical protein